MKSILLISAVLCSVITISNQLPRHETTKDWFQHGIFYQIYPLSFKDSDGDGWGDIRGVISKLDHLSEMGISGTWLSPVFVSPLKDFGYDIADFFNVDPLFGTNDDLFELFEKAKELDIKIILDFVPNHTSDQSVWFQQSIAREGEFTDYYVWEDGTTNSTGDHIPPNNWQSVFYGPAWTWNDERQQFYLHQFTKEQPDLNYRNPNVVNTMKNLLRFWLGAGAAGFRVDAVNHLFEVADLRDEPLTGDPDPYSYGYTDHHYTKDLDETYDMIYQWRQVLDEYTEGYTRIMMTEAYANTSMTMKYYESPDGTRQGSHMPFNFVLINDLHGESSANDFKRVIDGRINALPPGRVTNWVIGNHDQSRVGSRYGTEKIDVLLTLVMTLPGIAVTYQGEEIGMVDNRDGISYEDTLDPQACNYQDPNDYKWRSRDPERTPYQWDNTTWAGFSDTNDKTWLPVHENYRDLNLVNQKSFERSTFKFYKQLSELRKHHTMIDGDYESFVLNDHVLMYTRTITGHEQFVILLNFGAIEQTLNLDYLSEFDEFGEVAVAGADTCYNAGDKIPMNAVYLTKYDAVVLTNGKIVDDPTTPATEGPTTTDLPITTPSRASITITLTNTLLVLPTLVFTLMKIFS